MDYKVCYHELNQWRPVFVCEGELAAMAVPVPQWSIALHYSEQWRQTRLLSQLSVDRCAVSNSVAISEWLLMVFLMAFVFANNGGYYCTQAHQHFLNHLKMVCLLSLLAYSEINPLHPLLPCAIKLPVLEQVKLSFVIFDIRALWRLCVRVPGCQKLQTTA